MTQLQGAIAVVAGLLTATAAAQDTANRAPQIRSDVRDDAGFFSAEAVREAKQRLVKLEQQYHVPVTILSIDSLNDEPIEDVELREARRNSHGGMFLMISKRERKLGQPIVSRSFAHRFPEALRTAIRNAVLDGLKQGKHDEGLKRGIDAIEDALKSTVKAEPVASKLVVHDQVRLSLAGAQRALQAAEEKANAMELKVNIAVVDDGGHLLCFARMDGARPASVATAITKATTAATYRQATGPLMKQPSGTRPDDPEPDVLLNLSLQNAAAASGGKITTLFGGIPIVVDGQVIGAVGVGGAKGEQDAEIAKAGVDALLEDLKK